MLKERVRESYFARFRGPLASVEAAPQLAVLGVLSGVVTALVIILFRWAVEWPISVLLPMGSSEAFEQLGAWARALLPQGGAVLLAVVMLRLHVHTRKSGVVHVMERLGYHQGYMTFRNALFQFFAGIATVSSGQSAGREGPAVHLGAAFSSLMGQWLQLPNNSIRTLVGCGTAAAIAASFNTPIAGVIFAMEVVMMEYTIAGFMPVILAAVTAALISQVFYGADPAFTVPTLALNTLWEIPYIILVGVLIGALAAAFIALTRQVMRRNRLSLAQGLLAGGAITGLAGWAVPEVMGIGYDSVDLAFTGGLVLQALVTIAVVKLVVTAVAIGLGMPSGLIGPTLVIGAMAGAACGIVGAQVAPEMASSVGFYTMIGMGAMMGAVLQAPLSALMALLELTYNPHIILPAMLVIVVSGLVCSELFKQQSIFLSILKMQGLEYQNTPVMQALRRVSVGSILQREVIRSNNKVVWDDIPRLLKQSARWIILDKGDGGPAALLPTADLARYYENTLAAVAESKDSKAAPAPDKPINLLEIPAQRVDLAPVHLQATLQEALDIFDQSGVGALYVERMTSPLIRRVIGVVMRNDIENYYRYKKTRGA